MELSNSLTNKKTCPKAGRGWEEKMLQIFTFRISVSELITWREICVPTQPRQWFHWWLASWNQNFSKLKVETFKFSPRQCQYRLYIFLNIVMEQCGDKFKKSVHPNYPPKNGCGASAPKLTSLVLRFPLGSNGVKKRKKRILFSFPDENDSGKRGGDAESMPPPIRLWYDPFSSIRRYGIHHDEPHTHGGSAHVCALPSLQRRQHSNLMHS